MAANGVKHVNGKIRGDVHENTILHHSQESDGIDDDMSDDDDLDEDLLDKLSSSPSISDEDIDFEFVYALHTFIATVEGQANATKGDTMVLLDDSNSYWWLVRIVKDSSIGYLPAEHIETPSERLARLNKHRNVDLSTPMLGDTTEKSKNPLRKAMRRRNAKTVQFAPPTYVEAVEVDYSTDEDIDYDSNANDGALPDGDTTTPGVFIHREEGYDDDSGTLVEHSDAINVEGMNSNDSPDKTVDGDPRNSEDTVLAEKDEIATTDNKLRKGSLKHPDSAFFNDSAEPKRITLTPQLFRDDTSAPTSAGPVGVTPIREGKPKTSLERITKRDEMVSPPPNSKEKDKKTKKSMLGFFKKKNKKMSKDEEIDQFLHQEKRSNESSREASREELRADSREGKRSQDNSPQMRQQQQQPQQQQQQRQPQKQQQKAPQQQQQHQQQDALQAKQDPKLGGTIKRQQTGPLTSSASKSIRTIEQEAENEELAMGMGIRIPLNSKGIDMTQSTVIRSVSPEKKSLPVMNSLETDRSPKKYSSQDDMRSAHSVSPLLNPSPDMKTGHSPKITPVLSGAVNRSPKLTEHRLTESPEVIHYDEPPSLSVDTSSGTSEEYNAADVSPVEEIHKTSAQLDWSDDSFRTYLEDQNNNIRDFLVLVNHTTDVSKVKSHHEIVPLFADASSQLKDLTNRLDGMLGEWMQSRNYH